MLIRRSGRLDGSDVASSEITPKETFFNRRNFLTGAMAKPGVGAGAGEQDSGELLHPDAVLHAGLEAGDRLPSKYTVPDAQTPFSKATTFNNFYEFGTEKDDPARNAHTLRTRPWTVEVSGLVQKKQTTDIDSIMKYRPIESRVYRHRCVESVVDGDSVGRLFAERVHQLGAASTA